MARIYGGLLIPNNTLSENWLHKLVLRFVDSVDVLGSWIGVVKSGRLVVESVASI